MLDIWEEKLVIRAACCLSNRLLPLQMDDRNIFPLFIILYKLLILKYMFLFSPL